MGANLIHYCEVCGGYATHGVRDFFKWLDWDSDMEKMKQHGDTHFFCDLHNRAAIMTDISVSPMFYHKDMYDKL